MEPEDSHSAESGLVILLLSSTFTLPIAKFARNCKWPPAWGCDMEAFPASNNAESALILLLLSSTFILPTARFARKCKWPPASGCDMEASSMPNNAESAFILLRLRRNLLMDCYLLVVEIAASVVLDIMLLIN